MTEVLDKPLTRDEALTKLRALEPNIRAMGIVSLHLFGSTVRNEAHVESDVDLFGEVDDALVGGFKFFGLRSELSDLLGQKVDFIERSALHPLLKDRIEASAVCVF